MASLPRGLKPQELERLLSSFTDAVPSPRRGYAVVRLALDLGLRSAEINRLQLSDIDWRMGTVTLKRTKSRRQDTLPLADEIGLAIQVCHFPPGTSKWNKIKPGCSVTSPTTGAAGLC